MSIVWKRKTEPSSAKKETKLFRQGIKRAYENLSNLPEYKDRQAKLVAARDFFLSIPVLEIGFIVLKYAQGYEAQDKEMQAIYDEFMDEAMYVF